MGWGQDANGNPVYTPDTPGSAPRGNPLNDPYVDTDPNAAANRVRLLVANGFQWKGGNGANALWVAPNGTPISEANAFDVLNTALTHAPGAQALTYDQQMSLATAPRSSSSSSTSQSIADPRTLEQQQRQLDAQITQWKSEADAAKAQGDTKHAEWIVSRLDDLYKQSQTLQLQRDQLSQQASEGAANRANATGLQGANFLYQSGESQLGRQFTSGENALNRAQQAGEFAANYSITKANAERADKAAALQAAQTFSTMSGAPDLTGYDRFLAAGGGTLGGAIQRRATSLTDKGQLGAGRALQVAEQPLPTYADYSYTPTANPFMYATNPNITPALGYGGAYGGANPAPPAPVQTTPASAPAPPPPNQAPPASGGVHLDPADVQAGVVGGGWQPTPGFAGGTAAQPGYATGTFEAGDSTDPIDPAAGGAKPEQVTLQDPPGPNNARAMVTPLTDPGVGDGGRAAELGALLDAIGKFLSGSDGGGGGGGLTAPGVPIERPMLGGAPRRYALGTDINPVQPEDQPYIDRVMAMRTATPYNVNPYAADYSQQSPTSRAIGAAAFQTATGVPGTELQFEAQKYAPLGLNRSSEYRTLQLGI